MPEVVCNIVDKDRKPIYHALVIIDGTAYQLSGNSFKITTGPHHIKVLHQRFTTEEGKHTVTGPFTIVLGGDPASLFR